MRQKLHLKAPGNWVNDPNGFIYYKGKYHLFYQHNPNAPVWATMHWGHAVSSDLIHWEHLGIALYPSCYEDQDGCFSGSAIEKDGKLHVFYTGIRYLDKEKKDALRSAQLHIVSEDGIHFDNENGKEVIIPVIEDPAVGDAQDTRDPKVWREGDIYKMILGTTDRRERGRLLLYESPDLEKWTFAGGINGPRDVGWMWECPDLLFLENSTVLNVSPMLLMKDGLADPNQAITMPVKYTPGENLMEFPDSWQFIDCGMDLYAPQSTTDKDGRVIMTAWLRMPEPVEGRWNGMFSLPRVVEEKEGHVYFRMHPDIRAAFTEKAAELSDAEDGGAMIRIRLAEGESLEIGGYLIRRENGRILTDRSRVFPAVPDARLTVQTPPVREGELLEIIVDPNMIEIYINDGEYTISQAVYGLGNELHTAAASPAEIFTIPD